MGCLFLRTVTDSYLKKVPLVVPLVLHNLVLHKDVFYCFPIKDVFLLFPYWDNSL